MDKLSEIAQGVMDFLLNLHAQYETYYWAGLSGYEILNWLLLCLVLLLIYLITTHPLFFLARKNSLMRLGWKKINVQDKMHLCALSLARNEHYSLKPKFEIVLYHSDIFFSVEILALGSKKFALFVPEHLWLQKNDQLFSSLLHPKNSLCRLALLMNTLVLFFSITMKSLQINVFNFIQNWFKNKDLKQFLSLSVYFFFLPIIYTRLGLRLFVYRKLMTTLFDKQIAQNLSQDFEREFNNFLHKPISYFFGQIHEKN